MAHDSNEAGLDPKTLLRGELERRCRANPRYSLRAFARALGMSPTALSLVLSGKRPLSRKAAGRISARLPLEPRELLALEQWARLRPRERARAMKRLTGRRKRATDQTYELSLDAFALVAEWYHFAILNLVEAAGARFNAAWAARKLGINEVEATAAIERLERLGLLARKAHKRWKRVVPHVGTRQIPASARRKRQGQLLSKALHSLENDDERLCDFTSMTFAMDPALIPYAQERISRFRSRLARELEAKPGRARRVYVLAVELFPVSADLRQ